MEIPVETIEPNPFQVRMNLDNEIEKLSEAMRRFGLLEPICVRQHPSMDGYYQLVYGHRRLEAAKKLGWRTISAEIKNVDDATLLQMALVENVHRKDISDYEKGVVFRKLSEEFGLTYEEIGQMIGKTKQYVSNHIAMTKLFPQDLLQSDPKIIDALKEITEAHARLLARLENIEERKRLLFLTVSEKLCTKELGRLIGKPRLSNKINQDLPVWANESTRKRKNNQGILYQGSDRVCIIRKDSIDILLANLRVSPYVVGRLIGKNSAKAMMRHNLNPNNPKNWSKVLREKSRYAGWGNFSITTDMKIIIHNPSLDSEFLRGYLEELLGVRLANVKNGRRTQIFTLSATHGGF